jgi:hypothetical protein
MADIIGSGNHEGYALMKDFKEIIDSINKENKKRLLSPLTITLGDEFQGIARSLQDSISLIIKIEEKIVHLQKNIKLRYVLNHGFIDTDINPDIAYGMLGDGLTHARQLLESSKSERRDRFNISLENNDYLAEVLDLAFVGFQAIIDDWRLKDFELISSFLTFKGDYKMVAKEINKDNSSVFRRRDSLQIKEYFSSRRLLFNLTKSMNSKNLMPISEEEMAELI